MTSQFENIFEALKDKKSSTRKEQGSSKKPSPTPPPEIKITPSKPLAKTKDPDFEQTLIYLKIETKKNVKKLLLDDTSGRDFSDLVEHLLSDWISKPK